MSLENMPDIRGGDWEICPLCKRETYYRSSVFLENYGCRDRECGYNNRAIGIISDEEIGELNLSEKQVERIRRLNELVRENKERLGMR